MSIDKQYFSEGITKSQKHSDSLGIAARALYNIGHYRASINLAYQAIEECGKALLLKNDILDNKESISNSRWDKNYKDHKRKNNSHIGSPGHGIKKGEKYKQTEYSQGPLQFPRNLLKQNSGSQTQQKKKIASKGIGFPDLSLEGRTDPTAAGNLKNSVNRNDCAG